MATLTASAIQDDTAGSSKTVTITPSGTNRFGLVKIGHFTTIATLNVSSVMWGTSNITSNLVKSAVHDGANRKAYHWYYIVDPPAEETTITVTMSGTDAGVGVSAEAWSGVDQTTPYSGLTFTADNADGGTDPAVLTVTATSGKTIVAGIFHWTNGIGTSYTTMTPGSEQIEYAFDFGNYGGGPNNGYFGSAWATSDGSVTFSWDGDTGTMVRHAIYAIVLNDAPATGLFGVRQCANGQLQASGFYEIADLYPSMRIGSNVTVQMHEMIEEAGRTTHQINSSGVYRCGEFKEI